jgi:hypothetical protein
MSSNYNSGPDVPASPGTVFSSLGGGTREDGVPREDDARDGEGNDRAPMHAARRRRGAQVDEKQIFSRIHELVEEEHKLRDSSEHTDEQRARMRELEAHLDQAWDLLRQRRAKRQYGEDPDEASNRPEPEVENYLQ